MTTFHLKNIDMDFRTFEADPFLAQIVFLNEKMRDLEVYAI